LDQGKHNGARRHIPFLSVNTAESRSTPGALRHVPVGWITVLVTATLGALLAACDPTAQEEIVRNPSTAFSDHESTAIGKSISELAREHPGESGFEIIRYGRQAFTARIALTDLAERSLDVQYYIWQDDPTGRIFAERLVRAADRGVRVRVLLDDININGRDAQLVALNAHPNIEIRLFNPFAHRSSRALDFLFDMGRVNHRMHNKVMVMDNAIALVGGRNIGDHYFQVDKDSNFRDLDIVTIGPLVRDISNVFDRFWNGEWSVPVEAIGKQAATLEDMRDAVSRMRERISSDAYPHPLELDVEDLRENLDTIINDVAWAPGKVVWDDPSKIFQKGEPGAIHEALHGRLEKLEHDLFIESAYFVMRDRGIEVARQLEERGVRVRVLTNSLMANDVLAAHAGYAKRRKPLVEAGVELYELRPDPGPVDQKIISVKARSALHTKAVVFDAQDVFIGSYNLDPRSAAINTEAGLYVQSPKIAADVIDYMNEGIDPHNAYRVTLDDDGDLKWMIELDGQQIEYHTDPKSSWWQRLLVWFIELLPVENQL
jgi:putative cardiolipin synthase